MQTFPVVRSRDQWLLLALAAAIALILAIMSVTYLAHTSGAAEKHSGYSEAQSQPNLLWMNAIQTSTASQKIQPSLFWVDSYHTSQQPSLMWYNAFQTTTQPYWTWFESYHTTPVQPDMIWYVSYHGNTPSHQASPDVSWFF